MDFLEKDLTLRYVGIYPATNGTSPLVIPLLVSSSIGVFLSTAAFILLILTAVRFPEWRRSYKNQLLIQFMLARILYTVVRYTYDIKSIFDVCNKDCVIILNKYLTSYAEVTLVFWMFVFSRHMHDSLVKVFNVEKKNIWITSIWTWTLPAMLSCILFFLFSIQEGKDVLLYLIYLICLKWPILGFNAFLLISILRSVLSNNKSTQNNVKITVVMVFLIFMFSFQQFIVDIYKLVYVVLLNKYATYMVVVGSIVLLYHCAFSILFWVFGNSNTRKLWLNKKIRPQSQLINRNSML